MSNCKNICLKITSPLLLLFLGSAQATEYVYVGQPYHSDVILVKIVNGISVPTYAPIPQPFSSGMRATARIVTKKRLPSNLDQFTDIGPNGLNLIEESSFNNGIRTITNTDPTLQLSAPGSGRGSSSVITDNDGNIVNYEFAFVTKNPSLPLYDIFTIVGPFSSPIAQDVGTTMMFNAKCPSDTVYGKNCEIPEIYEDPDSYGLITWGTGKWYSFENENENENVMLTLDKGQEHSIDLISGKKINGKSITLGSTGNAIISTTSTLPAEIFFNTEAGSLNVSSKISPGNYTISYKLCDSKSEIACASYNLKILLKNDLNPVPGKTHAVPTLSHISLIGLSTLMVTFFGIRGFRRRT